MQMHKKHTVQSLVLGKDNFVVTIYPNVDYAFIVSLIVILDEINRESKEGWVGEIPVVLLNGNGLGPVHWICWDASVGGKIVMYKKL